MTIQKRGTITLNAAAYSSLGSPDAVELLYDDEDRILGLQACPVTVEHAAFVRPATRSPNGPYVISAMAFIKHYRIDTTEARRYRAEMRKSVLCADLAGQFDAVSKNSTSRRRARHPRPTPGSSGPLAG